MATTFNDNDKGTQLRDKLNQLAGDLESGVTDVQEAVTAAEGFAETAARGGTYEDTVSGLAAVPEGAYFSVPSAEDGEYLILYRHDSGPTATEIKRYPSSEAVWRLEVDQSDALFLRNRNPNQFTNDFYDVTERTPLAVASGTTFENVVIDGKPGIKIISNPSSGAGGARWNFNSLAFAQSGTVTVGAEIVRSDASSGISRFRFQWRDASGSLLREDDFDAPFAGLTEPAWYSYNLSVPAGASRMDFQILTYGVPSRETVVSKLFLVNGRAMQYYPPLADSSSGTSGAKVVYLAPDGNDGASGTRSEPLATLEAAIFRLGGEGTVIVRSGTYTTSTFQFNYADVRNLHVVGECRSVTEDVPLILGGLKLSGITLESGKVYKADAAGALITATPGWIWQDGVPDEQTLVPDTERHGLLRGRAHRLPCTKIVKTDATELSAAIAEIQASSVPKCFFDNATKTMYFSIAGGGDATSADIYTHINDLGGASWGRGSTTNVSQIASAGKFRATNLSFRYVSMNTRPFVEWHLDNISVLGGRTSSFHYASTGTFRRCEAMGSDGGGGGGGDGFNGHHSAVVTAIDCYTHDHNDDGESTHNNCFITAHGCISEYNGSAGFIPASGGHGRYFNCQTRKNGRQLTSSAGFSLSGAPGTGDDGVDTTSECYDCVSHDDPVGFKDHSGQKLTAYNCTAINSESTGFECHKAVDCGYIGSGAPKAARTIVVSTNKLS